MSREKETHKFRPISVSPRANEISDKMIKRFMKKVRIEGVIQEVFQRKAFEKPSAERRRRRAKNAFLRKNEKEV